MPGECIVTVERYDEQVKKVRRKVRNGQTHLWPLG